MSRLTGKGAGSLADAYASIYEGYGKKKEEKKGEDCTAASEKTTHNCAKKVCHEQFGEGTCVHGQHSFPDENGFVSHYDVEFSHGIEQAVPVIEMKVLEEGSHNEEAHEGMYDGEQLAEQSRPTGQQRAALRTARRQAAADLKATEVAAGGGQAGIDNALKQRYGGRMPSGRQQARHSSRNLATRSVAATGRENLYRGGGGDAAVKAGQTKDQVVAQGVKNFKAKQAAPEPAKPVQSANPVQSAKPVQSANTLNKDQQAVNKEYDRLRKSGDMAAAAAYGKKMAAAGASKSNFKMPEGVDLFDLVKGHLIDEGATAEEAMQKMIVMTQEEILKLAENRRAARAAGGYKDDSKKQTDPSKEGFTGISGSIKDIMRQNKEIEARNKKK